MKPIHLTFIVFFTDPTKKESTTYKDFKRELRTIIRGLKNTYNKDKSRKASKENIYGIKLKQLNPK